MASNMDIYNSLRQPPKTALKQIGGGKLKNFTDINPQWRYEAMTEQFGLCGIGWYYDIIRTWERECASGEILVFMEIALYVKENGEWSKPIRGTGGNKIVNIEGGKLVPNDEGYKNAETDALSVAMKKIGMGADVYAGKWDGSKYKNAENPEIEQTEVLVKANPDITVSIPIAKADVTFKTKAEAELVYKRFVGLSSEGFISQLSLTKMQSSYEKLKTEADYRMFIANCNKNIQDAEKAKAEKSFDDDKIPF